MAVLAVAAVGAVATAGQTGVSLALITAAVAAASIGAAYIDQRYVYPALFGKDKAQTPNVLGIDEMTGDDGSPGHRSWGRLALCGGHVLFFENYEVQNVGGGGSKKGTGAPAYKRRIADVGIGWTRNLITTVEQVLADQKVFWRRDPNNVIWSDYRVEVSTVTYTTTNDTLRLVPSTGDVQDVGQLFSIGSVVIVENSPTSAMNGYWRVKWVLPAGAGGGAPYGAMDLTPLQGQTPTAGSPGTSVSPFRIRRVDNAIIDHLAKVLAGTGAGIPGNNVHLTYYSDGPSANSASYYRVRPQSVFTPGTYVRVENASTVGGFVGLWQVVRVVKEFNGENIIELGPANGQSVTGAGSNPTFGTSASPAFITVALEDGFIEPDAQQVMRHYLGTETEGPDVDLLSVYGSGNVHGYRGLARSTIRKLNLTNWGDRVPQFSAAVKVSDSHTTHNVIRDLMREAFNGDDSRYDLSRLEANALLGYTRRGRQATTTTIQPLAIAYGIEAQEQGDRWTFFKGKDATVEQLAVSDFGAYVGRTTKPPRPFAHSRTQDADLPRSLSLYYRDPLNDFQRTEKPVTTALPEDGQAEEVAVDLDPLVLYPWDAQNVVNRLFDESLTARDQGRIVVPPSRMDLLPNDRLTFTALNDNEEEATIVGGEIDHTLAIGAIEPGSVSMEVELDVAGRFRIVDDGEGNLIGWPDEAGDVTATIDYETGEIAAACADDTVIAARIRYEFPNPWRMRVQRVTRRVNWTTEIDLVAVADKFPVVGSPVQTNEPAIAPVVRPAQLRWEVLDIPTPTVLDYEQPGLYYAACAQPGSEWRGAIVYSSRDGTSYEARGSITLQSTIGRTTDELGSADPAVPDWENSVNVVLDRGTLDDADLDQLGAFPGRNLALIGDEIVSFQRATLETDGSYTLTGLLRGRRDTDDAIDDHAAGDRFVLLDGLGFPNQPDDNGTFDDLLVGDIGRSLYWKIVPNGGLLDDVEAIQLAPTGRNVLPFRPSALVQGSIADHGSNIFGDTYDADAWTNEDIVVRWSRRSRSPVSAFGSGTSAPLLEPFERYEIRVLKDGTEIAARRTLLGGQNMGSPMVHRQFRYTLAQQTADGWASGDVARIEVRQVGAFGLSPPASIEWTVP